MDTVVDALQPFTNVMYCIISNGALHHFLSHYTFVLQTEYSYQFMYSAYQAFSLMCCLIKMPSVYLIVCTKAN